MTSKTSTVLYRDHSNHPSPLSLTYHATASRHLSSPLHPSSIVTEVDTSYCPQCLDPISSSNKSSSSGKCPKPHCRLCPVCRSTLAIAAAAADDDDGASMNCFYKCGYCRWTSLESGVFVRVEGGAAAGRMANVAKDLAVVCERRLDEVESGLGETFRLLVDGWGRQEQEEKRKREKDILSRPIKSSAKSPKITTTTTWSIETLEKSIESRKRDEAKKAVTCLSIKNLFVNDDDDDEDPSSSSPPPPPAATDDDDVMVITTTTLERVMQNTLHAGIISKRSDLLPLQVPLRAKKSRRCRKELAAGRTGILVKPKGYPLEGDSSMRSSHGKWWKKDSSAIHVVPKVEILKHGRVDGDDADNATCHYILLLKVKNPTIGTVRLRFNASCNKDETTMTTNLDNVLIDHMAQEYVSAQIVTNATATAGMSPTETIELHAAEDSLIDFGKRGPRGDPIAVESWTKSSALDRRANDDSASTDGGITSLTLLAQKEDVAWLELVMTESVGEFDKSSDEYIAIPLVMEIEVGNGSWESSLVKPRIDDEGDNKRDFVPLDLLLVWKK